MLLNWEQNAPFPVLFYEFGSHSELLDHQVNKLPEHQREKVRATLHGKISEIFKKKMGLNFSV